VVRNRVPRTANTWSAPIAKRAALALTEAVTLIDWDGVTGEVWADVPHFDDLETVHLLMAIATINVWNRLPVSAPTSSFPISA
jgi:alkylhydroperoxidase family enzyme